VCPTNGVDAKALTCATHRSGRPREDDPLVEDELRQPKDEGHRRETDGDDGQMEAVASRCKAGDGTGRQAR